MVGFFLPGDSLLVTAGLFAARGDLNIVALVPSLIVAAICGNTTGYWIGIRSALGAEPVRIARLVLGEGARVAVGGCVLGTIAAFALARLIRGRLYGVSPADPTTYVAVILVLGAAALLASYIPARRAARVDPTEALRAE